MKTPATALLLFAGLVPAGGQTFTFVQAYFDGQTQAAATLDGLSDAFATALSPDGLNVYVCSGIANVIGSDNAIAVFARNVTGKLTFIEAHFDDDDGGSADGLSSCRDVVVSPDGKHVYTAGRSDNKIGIFSRNAATGVLSFSAVVEDGVGLVDGLAGVEAIALTADGQTLFAVGAIDDAMAAFSRDAMTGALTFKDVEKEGVGGVSGLDRPLDVAVSPDGQHVYTAAGSNENFSGSDAVAVFDWNGTTGALTFVDAYFEGELRSGNTIDGLDRVSGVVVSPDGKHVYATGGLDPVGDQDWIAIFSRSNATGELTWIGAIDHFLFCDFDILFGFETWAVLSPDGTRVFVTSPATAVVEFSRNPVTGALTFADSRCFFDDLSLGINLPRKLSLDPTGEHLYVPGQASDAVAVFQTEPIFADGFESGNTSAWAAAIP